MFYRIKNNSLYDCADYKYCEDCSELLNITVDEYYEELFAYEIQDDKLVCVKDSTSYFEQKNKINAEKRKNEIMFQLEVLDKKRIRALCEPELINDNPEQSWLEFYNNQIKDLRTELEQLDN